MMMRTAKRKFHLTGLSILRKQLGFSQELMAIYLGVNHSTVKLAELGERKLPTAALVKLANMEIQMAAGKVQDEFKDMHPAEQVAAAAFDWEYNDIFRGTEKLKYESYFLERKLDLLTGQYKKAREKLQVIEALLPQTEGDVLKKENLQRQYNLAKDSLIKCGMPVQALLKTRIAFLQAQTRLYLHLKEQLKEHLSPFLFEKAGMRTTL